MQALQRLMKVRMFYINLARADLQPYVTAIKKADPMSANTTHRITQQSSSSAARCASHSRVDSCPLLWVLCCLAVLCHSSLVAALNCVAWMLDCKVIPEAGKEKEVSRRRDMWLNTASLPAYHSLMSTSVDSPVVMSLCCCLGSHYCSSTLRRRRLP